MRAAVEEAATILKQAGYTLESIDISVLLDAASLLYGSALVSERFAAVGEFVLEHAEQVDPTVGTLILNAQAYAAADLAQAQHEVGRFRVKAAALLDGFDALLLPTTTSHPSISDVLSDPLGTNIVLGTYTNFVNLLDLAAIAVPVSAGVSVVGPAFTDQVLLDVASVLIDEPLTELYAPVGAELAVFGAHMRGEPLNHQLTSLGARFVDEVQTAPRYRMVALATTPPKPGILHDPVGEQRCPASGGRSRRPDLASFLLRYPTRCGWDASSLPTVAAASASTAIRSQPKAQKTSPRSPAGVPTCRYKGQQRFLCVGRV